MSTATTHADPTTTSVTQDACRTRPARVAASAALAFGAGVGTSWAQGAFPDWLHSLANSAGGWTLVVVPLLWWSAARPLPAAALGGVYFFLLNAGYAALSAVHGLTWSLSPTNFWVGVGFLAGPLVGLGVVWLRDRRDVLAAVGAAGLSGLLIGEGVYGLTVISHTSPAYWIGSIAVGAGVLLAFLATRAPDVGTRLVAVLGTAAVVGLQTVAYAVLNSWTPEV